VGPAVAEEVSGAADIDLGFRKTPRVSEGIANQKGVATATPSHPLLLSVAVLESAF
jgi:hypothetical protein